jgi:hypothetical protein
MKTHGQISHAAFQPLAVTAGRSHRAPRPGQLVRTALILALVLGSLGAAEAESLSLSTSHAGAQQAVIHVRPAQHLLPVRTGVSGPWMY